MAENDPAADKPLTMKLDNELPPPPPSPVEEEQLLLPSMVPGDGGPAVPIFGTEPRAPSLLIQDTGKPKRGPWPGKKCAVAMLEGDNAKAGPRCVVDTQPQSGDHPVESSDWNSDEPREEGRCDKCSCSCWICLYCLLACCEYPCKDPSK